MKIEIQNNTHINDLLLMKSDIMKKQLKVTPNYVLNEVSNYLQQKSKYAVHIEHQAYRHKNRVQTYFKNAQSYSEKRTLNV